MSNQWMERDIFRQSYMVDRSTIVIPAKTEKFPGWYPWYLLHISSYFQISGFPIVLGVAVVEYSRI